MSRGPFDAMRSPSPVGPARPRAVPTRARGRFDLNFINLDGNIACLVNGAGLPLPPPAPLISYHIS